MKRVNIILKGASVLLAMQLAFTGGIGAPMTVYASSIGTVTQGSTNKKATVDKTENKANDTKDTKDTKETKSSDTKTAELDKREKELNEREAALDKREAELDKREVELNKKATTVSTSTNVATGKLIEGVNITRIGTANDENVQAVINGFNALPAKMQDTILAGGYKFEVTSEDIEKLITGTGTNSWYGATAGTPLFVAIIGTNQTLAEMTRTTIHECGHALDNSLGIITNLPEFQQIYAAEGKTMYKTADVHDASEWFSECCVYWIQSPAILKQTAPMSYNYMENLFTNILK